MTFDEDDFWTAVYCALVLFAFATTLHWCTS